MSLIDEILKETPDTKACRLGPGVTEQIAELFRELFPAAKRALVIDDVNTKRVAGDRGEGHPIPFTLESGEWAELENGRWTHYSSDGDPVERTPAASVRLAKGASDCRFRSDDPDVRSEISFFILGEKIPALTEKPSWADAKALSYEAALPQRYAPTKGFGSVDPVTVRPGETARLEVSVRDDVKRPTLSFPAEFGQAPRVVEFPAELKKGEHLVCRDGVHWIVFDKDRKTLAEGALPEPLPTVKGTVRIGFSSADPATANCRVGFVKRY